MKSLSIWHWLIFVLLIILIFGVRRLGSIPGAFRLLFSAQPANSRREAAYIDDSPTRKPDVWLWLSVLAVICAVGLFVSI